MSWALVTGASSGIGEAFAREIAVRGHNVVLVARREEKLQKLAEELRQYYGVETEVVVADLADEKDLEVVAKLIGRQQKPISLLVNNAGFALGQNFVDGDLNRELNALNVMVKALMVLSYAAANSMRKRGRGGIINLASVASDLYMGTYSAHKSWVDRFTLNLAAELANTGVLVTSLKPGTTRTAFFDPMNMRGDVDKMPELFAHTPAYVAKCGLDALSRGQLQCVPGMLYTAVNVLSRYAPQALVRVISSDVRKRRMKL